MTHSRLVDLICGEGGYFAMPSNVLENAGAIRELLQRAGKIVEKERP